MNKPAKEAAATIYTTLPTPLGPLLLTSNGTALTGLFMNEHRHGPPVGAGWIADDSATPFAEATRQLSAYFAGTLTDFDLDHLPLAPSGTAFQQRVWAALAAIPFGTTLTYGALARRLGDPNASRAVGLANGRNPLSLIVPCHRVIGAKGKLVGYGGGLSRKQALLAWEASVTAGRPHSWETLVAAAEASSPPRQLDLW